MSLDSHICIAENASALFEQTPSTQPLLVVRSLSALSEFTARLEATRALAVDFDETLTLKGSIQLIQALMSQEFQERNRERSVRLNAGHMDEAEQIDLAVEFCRAVVARRMEHPESPGIQGPMRVLQWREIARALGVRPGALELLHHFQTCTPGSAAIISCGFDLTIREWLRIHGNTPDQTRTPIYALGLSLCEERRSVVGWDHRTIVTGARKGSALLTHCAYCDVSPTQTLAIGDSRSDVELFRTAGVSVLVCKPMAQWREYERALIRELCSKVDAIAVHSLRPLLELIVGYREGTEKPFRVA